MGRWRLPALALLAAAQIAVPAWMILDYERTLRSGHAYKVRAEPVDPVDAFRGRYVALRLEVEVLGEPAPPPSASGGWATLVKGPDGFARASQLSVERPSSGDCVPVVWAWTGRVEPITGPATWRVVLPYDRYYLEESKAPRAEELTRLRPDEPLGDVHAVIRVRDGRGVLEAVYVGSRRLEDALRGSGRGGGGSGGAGE